VCVCACAHTCVCVRVRVHVIFVELLAWLTHGFLKIYSNVASLRVGSEIYFILLKTRVGNSVRSASLT